MQLAWFENRAAYESVVEPLHRTEETIQQFMEDQDSVGGFCNVCDDVTRFKVDAGVYFGTHPNLREGMLCVGCGTSGRQRLVYAAIMERLAPDSRRPIVIFEQITGFYRILKEKFPFLRGAEFLGEGIEPGTEREANGFPVNHEDLTSLSFDDESISALIHCDVLEHVGDYQRALEESKRVLKPGGQLLFCVPFFDSRDETLVRARRLADGSIDHIEEPEYHGNPLMPEGSLAFYHYGWDLLERCRASGFSRAEIGFRYDPFQGFLPTTMAYAYCIMQPMLFLCTR